MSLSVGCRAPITEQRLRRFLRRALGGCWARPSKASSLAPRRAGACHGRVSATRRRARARVSVCVSVRVCASVRARASASVSLRDAGAAVFARGRGWGAGERGGGRGAIVRGRVGRRPWPCPGAWRALGRVSMRNRVRGRSASARSRAQRASYSCVARATRVHAAVDPSMSLRRIVARNTPPAGLEPAIFGLEVRRLVH